MTTHTTRQEVRRVLLVTLILNLVVAAGKIIVGTASGVLAITADGFHSLIDGSSNVVALAANTIAAKPPDEDHPYGHRRFETLAALMIGALLLLTAWEIVRGAVEQLMNPEPKTVNPVTFAVLGGTLLVNLFVSTYERQAGRRLNSELLMADAANTGADVFVTLSVIASTALVALFGWSWVDPAAALLIVFLIGRAGLQVLSQTGGVLVDRAPYSPGELSALVEQVPAVQQIVRVRSRGPADAAHIDIDVEVAPETTADHAAAIAGAIRQTLRENLDGVAEVEVHFEPINDAPPNHALIARARADALGLQTHEVRLTDGPGGKVLELHVEVPPDQTLAEAHDQVTRLEADIRASLPEVAEIVTHIEPAADLPVDDGCAAASAAVEREAAALLSQYYPQQDWHDLRATCLDDGYALLMHVTMPANTRLADAHQTAESAELLLRTQITGLQRVTIHTEPPE